MFLQIVFLKTSMMRESSLFIETEELAGETGCVEEVLVPVAPANVGGVVLDAEFIPLEKKYLINIIFSNYFILFI